MRAILEQMLLRGQMPCAVHTELAKWYEHQAKDAKKALDHANAARKICVPGEETALDRRIERLKKKLDQ